MTFFGQTLTGTELLGLMSMLMVLAYLILSLRNMRANQEWLNDALARREALRQARAPKPEAPAPDRDSKEKSGPWG